MTVLTPRQSCERLIRNDERNIRDVLRYGASLETRYRLVTDCAARLFEARPLDRELERQAEENLREALKLVYP